MTNRLTILGAAFALSAAFAAPALADYMIETEGELPSVVFVDFDEETEERIASYTDQSDDDRVRTAVVEDGGEGGADTTASLDSGSGAATRRERSAPESQGSGSFAEESRAPTPNEIERMIVEGEIEKRIFEDSNLR